MTKKKDSKVDPLFDEAFAYARERHVFLRHSRVQDYFLIFVNQAALNRKTKNQERVGFHHLMIRSLEQMKVYHWPERTALMCFVAKYRNLRLENEQSKRANEPEQRLLPFSPTEVES